MKKQLLLFLMTLLPLAAWADSSGTCGNSLTWTYVEATKTLTISGSGDMTYNQVPWYNISDKILNVIINDGVTSIGNSAFAHCSGLKSVAIGNSVTSIGEYAFFNCDGLTSITIPNSVTSIGKSAFQNCDGLTSITIPNSVTSISESVFSVCSGLTSVIIPNSVTSIGNSAFAYCSGLKSVTIGNSVTSIGGSAFSGCSGLTSITIPNSVTSIGVYAFLYCSGLKTVTIGTSVTSIADRAFWDCSGLKSVNILDIAAWCNIKFDNIYANPLYYAHHLYLNGDEIKDLVIPNSVTSIGVRAFYACSGLKTLTIGNSVTSIGDEAFYSCSMLTSVIVKMKTPVDIDSNTFSNRKSTTLFVPSGCKGAYASANYWKEFKEIVEMVEGPDISQMNNAIYVEPLSSLADNDVSINVCMKNANAVTSYGFELMLPQGLSIAATSEGDFDDAVTMSTRHKGHTLTTNKLSNNTYKVGVASLSSKALTDNDGLVLTIKAYVADNMALGEHPIFVLNPLIVNADGAKPAVQSILSKITIEDYTKGDVDGDGVVDLADAVLVINHYVGKPVNKFVTRTADVDGDGVIDLADAVHIVNFYVGKIQSLAPGINIDGLDPQ